MDIVEEGGSSDELAIRGLEEDEVAERPAPSRSRTSRKPPKDSQPRGGSKNKLTYKTKAKILVKSRKTRVIEDTDEHEDAPLVNVSATEEEEIDPVRPQSCTSRRGRHAVTMPPPPSAPPAVSINLLVEGDKIVSTYRSPSDIKAKTIPQSTKDEPQSGRAIKTPSLPTPADEVMSYRSPSNIQSKTIPQSTKDEPPTGKTPSLPPAPPTVAVHPVKARAGVSFVTAIVTRYNTGSHHNTHLLNNMNLNPEILKLAQTILREATLKTKPGSGYEIRSLSQLAYPPSVHSLRAIGMSLLSRGNPSSDDKYRLKNKRVDA
jgi:hypothetical protein